VEYQQTNIKKSPNAVPIFMAFFSIYIT